MTGSAGDVDAFLSDLFGGNDTTTVATGGHDHHAHHGHDHHASSTSLDAGHDHSSHGGGHVHAGHVMKMWFHGGCEEVILFDWWRTEGCWGMLFSCLLIFVMGAAYEGIKWFRVYLQMQQTAAERCPRENGIKLQEQQALHSHCKTSNSQDDVYNPTTTPPQIRTSVNRFSSISSNSAFSAARMIQAFLYIVQLVLAYWLMLIVMTYNNYLTAAVILGAGFGHWLFAVIKIRNPLGETADSFATDACH